MHPHKCGVKINFDILSTHIYQLKQLYPLIRWKSKPLNFIKPPFHWTAIPLRSWRSSIFSKIIPNRRESVDSHTIDASSTLPLRCCYDPPSTMKIWLRLVYADVDVAATLLRPRRWSYTFDALLYPFYIESEIPIRFYYDLGASTALLPFLLRFVNLTKFDQNFES